MTARLAISSGSPKRVICSRNASIFLAVARSRFQVDRRRQTARRVRWPETMQRVSPWVAVLPATDNCARSVFTTSTSRPGADADGALQEALPTPPAIPERSRHQWKRAVAVQRNEFSRRPVASSSVSSHSHSVSASQPSVASSSSWFACPIQNVDSGTRSGARAGSDDDRPRRRGPSLYGRRMAGRRIRSDG